MSIRVAHIIAGLGIGGAERHLVNLLNAMSCESRAVICIGRPRPGPTFHRDLDPAVDQVFVRVRRRSLPIGIFRLASELRKRRINVVHTHMYESNLFGVIAARVAGVPVVLTSEHGENPWKGPVHRLLERWLISSLADLRFCVSPRILDIRRERDGVPESKLRLTVNGTVTPSHDTSRTSKEVPVIGAVGRFIPAKNYAGLLEAVAQLHSRGYRLRLCIVGHGPEAERVQGIARELGLEAIVEFPGMVSDMDSWYRKFDLFVSSSIREGLPVAMLEAMAYGLPVVATDVGACAEAVRHEEGGLIVPPGDPAVLADALASLLDNVARRDAFGRNARRRVEQHYSVATVADTHMQIYRKLLRERSPE